VIQLPASTDPSVWLQTIRRLLTRCMRDRLCLGTLLLALLIWPSIPFAETAILVPLAQKAIEKLDATDLDSDWYFTMEIVEDNEVRIIRNNPRGGKYDKRELVTVNGSVPDSRRNRKFRESEMSRIDELDPDASGYAYLVDTETLELILAGSDTAEFSFRPKIQAMGDAQRQLRGSVLLNLETQQIEKIEIFNTGKLSPGFSVTLDTYRLILGFQPEQGEVLLNKLDSQAIGRAGFLKSFEKVVSVTFGDYKRASQ
jgi:hypothetical protein